MCICDLAATRLSEWTNDRPKREPIFTNAQLFYWVDLNISLMRDIVVEWSASAQVCVLKVVSCVLWNRYAKTEEPLSSWLERIGIFSFFCSDYCMQWNITLNVSFILCDCKSTEAANKFSTQHLYPRRYQHSNKSKQSASHTLSRCVVCESVMHVM